jgi:peroxiredoxin
MRRPRFLLLALALAATGSLRGQTPIAVGAAAPDFTLPGATMAGPLSAPLHLADLQDQTVVIAFFYKARTKG